MHVKCTLHMGFHIGLYIQCFEITNSNNAENGNKHDGFLHNHSLSQHQPDIFSSNFLQSWTGPWDTPTPWDRAHFSLPQQQMFQFFELNTSIIVLSIFTESLIKLQAEVLELSEKECILGLKTIS